MGGLTKLGTFSVIISPTCGHYSYNYMIVCIIMAGLHSGLGLRLHSGLGLRLHSGLG